MKADEIRQWAKDNKQALVAKLLTNHASPASGDKIAIFMAGLPGAGKTELVRRLIPHLPNQFVVIEHDRLVEPLPGYKPELAYDYRPAGSTLVTAALAESLARGLSFIVDATLSSPVGRSNIKKALGRGYYVVIIHVDQDPDVARDFTQKREVVVGRGISSEGFDAAWQKLGDNLDQIKNRHRNNPNFQLVHIDKTPGTAEQPAKITTTVDQTNQLGQDLVRLFSSQAFDRAVAQSIADQEETVRQALSNNV